MTGGVLVIDHFDSYTHNLVHLIAAVTGAAPRVMQHVEPGVLAAAAAASHVVLSPGPGHPGEAADFALGATVFDLDRPVLGVCLGMQALVHHCGGTVRQGRPAHGEVASVSHDGSGLFEGIADGFAAVRYHSLVCTDIDDPLAVTATCPDPSGEAVVMAVRHRYRPHAGVQFHPESILSEHGTRLIANFLEWT